MGKFHIAKTRLVLLFFGIVFLFSLVIPMFPQLGSSAGAVSQDKLTQLSKAWLAFQFMSNEGFENDYLTSGDNINNLYFVQATGDADCDSAVIGRLVSPGDGDLNVYKPGFWTTCAGDENRRSLLLPILQSLSLTPETFLQELGYSLGSDGKWTGGSTDKAKMASVLFNAERWPEGLTKGDFANGVAPEFVQYQALVAALQSCGPRTGLLDVPTSGTGPNNLWLVSGSNAGQYAVEVNNDSSTREIGKGTGVGEDRYGNLSCGNIKGRLIENGQSGQSRAQSFVDALAVQDSTPPPNAGGGATTDQEPDPCDIFNNSSLRWILCPIFTGVAAFTTGLDGLIQGLLEYDMDMFANGGLKTGWQTFRGFALTLLVIAALVMVISQALSLSFLDAYTIKKVLPRILIAIIGISLSWEIIRFVVMFFNDIGNWIGAIIESSFGIVASDSGSSIFWQITGQTLTGAGIAIGVGVGAPAAIASAPIWGPLVLSLLGTGAVALAIGVAVLGLRLAIITACLIIAPLAIAAWILPGTKKLWDFWQNTLMTVLIMFPIVMGFIALGKGMAYVVGATSGGSLNSWINVTLAMLLYLAPYFMLPFVFKLAGGLMKTIFSIADDKSKGFFDKQRKFREERSGAKKSRQEAGLQGGAMAGWRQRSAAARHGSAAWGGDYQTHRRHQMHTTAAKAVQDDASWALGDDDASAVVVDPGVRNRADFMRAYMARGKTKHEAEEAANRIETSIGAIGQDTTRVAAFKARAMSNTAYKAGDYQQIAREARALMNAGVMSSADAAGSLKANRGRADINGLGFSDWVGALEGKTKLMGPDGQPVLDASGKNVTRNIFATNAVEVRQAAESMASQALEGARPGDIVGGHSNGVKALSEQMVANLTRAHAIQDPRQRERAVMQELAVMAGRYDAMASSNPQNARLMAKVLEDNVVTSKGPNGAVISTSIRELIEQNRDNSDFLNMRREIGNRASADAAARIDVQPQEPPQQSA